MISFQIHLHWMALKRDPVDLNWLLLGFRRFSRLPLGATRRPSRVGFVFNRFFLIESSQATFSARRGLLLALLSVGASVSGGIFRSDGRTEDSGGSQMRRTVDRLTTVRPSRRNRKDPSTGRRDLSRGAGSGLGRSLLRRRRRLGAHPPPPRRTSSTDGQCPPSGPPEVAGSSSNEAQFATAHSPEKKNPVPFRDDRVCGIEFSSTVPHNRGQEKLQFLGAVHWTWSRPCLIRDS